MDETVPVRPMRETDLEGGLRLAEAAGWNQRLADWRLVHSLSGGAAFVAAEGERIAATTAAVRYANRVAWVAMVLVDPAYRRRGLATRLMQATLESLAACDTVKLDATPAGREVYLKLGFEDESGLTRFQIAAAPASVPAAVPGPRIRPLTGRDLPAVAALDAEAFGCDRSELLARLLEMAPDYARVAEGAEGIEGFGMGRHGLRWEYLGPLAARTETAARALAAATLSAMAGRPALADAPDERGPFQAWLRERGFAEQRAFIRMRKGPDRHPGRPDLVYAIAGPEFG